LSQGKGPENYQTAIIVPYIFLLLSPKTGKTGLEQSTKDSRIVRIVRLFNF
jgi:hypothetical protein